MYMYDYRNDSPSLFIGVFGREFTTEKSSEPGCVESSTPPKSLHTHKRVHKYYKRSMQDASHTHKHTHTHSMSHTPCICTHGLYGVGEIKGLCCQLSEEGVVRVHGLEPLGTRAAGVIVGIHKSQTSTAAMGGGG